ncbi:ammonium transporter [Alicyclobacillus fastidiosus]|uniref:Ammonium transporter n=1 Tax=Alicyclobacillus fastidiosus TaxID=392011 RepID=A0ABY6ZGQ9_9BACL|nr:ammonium transporter [Alicyclobacillus fastidiosus]WAH41905.1 ammonium transporter [Alicyclobacillus fastidiosus]GMA63617.1 ammonium transporter [Alicyclobacillus fastidiosus]
MENALNTVWVVLTAALVLFMEGGFSLLEAGLVRTKNAVNVTMKIFVDLTFGALAFYLVGSHLLFGRDTLHVVGFGHVLAPSHLSPEAFILFQIGFAIAVASIISGAVAERFRFTAYIVTVCLTCAVIYPVSAHWIWGEHGWLADLGMEDFAGSAAIHAMGGFMALALALVVGPRKNRFNRDGSVNVFAPSNIPLASCGAFILWFGWFGFNAGSTLSAVNVDLASIALNTFLAAAAGGMSAILFSTYRFKVADPSMTINGSLSGLVAVTAGCAYIGPYAAIVLGLVAGVLVILATGWVDALKIDDPVGAVAVHGFGGVLGTLGVGLFDRSQGLFTTGHVRLLAVQLLGILVVSAWGFSCAFLMGLALKRTIGIRVGSAEEEAGLDIVAHGIPAYNELERFSDGNQLSFMDEFQTVEKKQESSAKY